MKHLLNDLSGEERNRILEQYNNSILVETKKFNKLLKSKLGNIKPLLNEQVDFSKMTFEELKNEYNKIQNIDEGDKAIRQMLMNNSESFKRLIFDSGEISYLIDQLIKSIQENKKDKSIWYKPSEYPPISNELKKFLERYDEVVFNENYEKLKKIAELLSNLFHYGYLDSDIEKEKKYFPPTIAKTEPN